MVINFVLTVRTINGVLTTLNPQNPFYIWSPEYSLPLCSLWLPHTNKSKSSMAIKPSKSPHLTFILLVLFLLAQSQATTPRFPASVFQSQKKHPHSFVSASVLNSGHDQPAQQLYKEEFFTQILDHFSYTVAPHKATKLSSNVTSSTTPTGERRRMLPYLFTRATKAVSSGSPETPASCSTSPQTSTPSLSSSRFYGKSIPFRGDKHKAYKDATTLGYLSTTQALADFATLIVDLKKNFSATESPVVVFGGSYGGMLAAWFRLKYPHRSSSLFGTNPRLGRSNLSL
ncbi:Lysosomal Pro-X carboxypeptidase [Linum grandiflorum]